jgi:ankyrin repeat protein
MVTSFYLLTCFLLLQPIMADSEQTNPVNSYTQLSKTALNTAFIDAVKQNQVAKVDALLKAGADVTTPIIYEKTDPTGDDAYPYPVKTTALMAATSFNQPVMVATLIKYDKHLDEALDLAIIDGHNQVADVLIKGGANVNTINTKPYRDKDTPLITAIKSARAYGEFNDVGRWKQRRDIVQTLLNANANLHTQNNQGRTALMEAVIKHDLANVENILNHLSTEQMKRSRFSPKKIINLADKEGNTALILAFKYIHYQYVNAQERDECSRSQNIMRLLMAFPGIDVKHVNRSGESAISLGKQLLNKLNPDNL